MIAPGLGTPFSRPCATRSVLAALLHRDRARHRRVDRAVVGDDTGLSEGMAIGAEELAGIELAIRPRDGVRDRGVGFCPHDGRTGGIVMPSGGSPGSSTAVARRRRRG